MKPTMLIAFAALFICNWAFGQDREKYAKLIKEAEGLYDNSDYLTSAKKYADAFVALGNKGMVTDRYNAACSWALANQTDSAFVQLFKIAKKGNYTNYNHLVADSDLKSLYEDDRWEKVKVLVKANKDKAEANLDKPLVAILDTIYQEDQKYRMQIQDIQKEYGWESDEMQAHWKIIMEKDSINLIKVSKILDEQGWLGRDVIGGQGNQTLFLVIQHSDLETQEKYLPMMREAVKKNNANPSSLALLEDRVALRKGERQIYGSQIGRDQETGEHYVLPLDDPMHVDERRAAVGLSPLQDYVSRWNVNWDPEAYLKQLPELEAKSDPRNGFYGMWTLEVEGGGVGWLEVHKKEGFLDANLLWRGGSVLPVSHVYFADPQTLVVTRTRESIPSGEDQENARKHIITSTYRITRHGNKLEGIMTMPKRDGSGESQSAFTGVKLPEVPPAPDLSKLKYGEPISLFNGKDLSGWRMVDPEHANGFKAADGILMNNPVQKEGEHLHYGNLRTEQEFEDFNLTLEVNVPKDNNSGIYLRGMYEIQVVDSYGQDLDPHNMGGLYSRIKPTVAAEKPAGEWQSFDITLCERHVTVILNGKKIIDNQPVYGPTGGAIIADVFSPGPIFLQGDHGTVSYRKIVLKPIIK